MEKANKNDLRNKLLRLNFNLKNEIFRFIPLTDRLPKQFLISQKLRQNLLKNNYYKILLYSTKKFKSKLLFLESTIALIREEFKNIELSESEFMDTWCFIFNKTWKEQNLRIDNMHLENNPETEDEIISLINIQYLTEAIKFNKTIKNFDFEEFIFYNKNKQNVILIYEALKANKSIEKMSYLYTHSDSFGFYIPLLDDLITNSKTMKIFYYNSATDEKCLEASELICNAIAQNASIEKIFVSEMSENNPQITKKLMEALTKNTNIKELTFRYREPDRMKYEYLSEFIRESKSLKRFHLQNASFGNYLEGIEMICNAIKDNPNHIIEEIDFSSNQIINSMLHISKILKNPNSLKHLNLSHNYLGNYDGQVKILSEALIGNSTLEILDLTGNSLLRPTNVNCLFEAISSLKNLKTLGFSYNKDWYDNENKQVYVTFFESILNCGSIETLDFSHNRLGLNEEAINFFPKFLLQNKTLKEINLERNGLCQEKFPCLEILVKAFIENKTIKTLNISRNNFKEMHIDEISNLINHNKCIESFNIGGSLFYLNEDNTKLKVLTEAIAQNKTIRKIVLGNNVIGFKPKNLRLLCDSLIQNETLEEIDLSYIALKKANENVSIIKNMLKKTKREFKLILNDRRMDKNKRLVKILKKDDRIVIKTKFNDY